MLSTLICASLFATNASQIDYAPDNLSAELKIDSTDFDGTQHVWTFNLPQNKTIKVTRINSVHLIRNNVETMQLLVDETNDLITDVRDIYKAGIFVDTIENATSLKVVLNFPQNFSYQPKNPVITIRFAVIDEHPSTELILLNGDVEVVSGAFSTSGYQDFMGTKVTAILGDDYNEYTCFGSARGGMIRGSNEGYLILSGNPNGYGNRNVYINRYTSNGDVIMTAGSGQVGIGVDEPEYKLDVAGTVHANSIIADGNIRASEIIVSTTGADFVFADDYQLRPLSEVKTFIQENKHLPEIKSAQEMQENGVGINELQTQLLQKIEELTLYILQQEERIKALEAELNK
jgi:hypothetical protein